MDINEVKKSGYWPKEKRIEATMERLSDLEKEAEKDPELHKSVFTRIRDNPKCKYFSHPGDSVLNISMYSAMFATINDKNANYIPYFIINGAGKYIGFIAYLESKENPKIIEEIKNFNFFNTDIIMANDVKDMADELLTKYTQVNWSSYGGNSVINNYTRYLKKKESEGYIVSRDPFFEVKIIKEFERVLFSISVMN